MNDIKRKVFKAGDLQGFVQFNPGRKSSTTANVTPQGIEKRKCFLCKDNRPADQPYIDILPEWELLENPFPIFPQHKTIVSKSHIYQHLDPELGNKLAQLLPEYVVFYNDPGAGASAPDHAHYQAVPRHFLPLINLLESEWPEKDIELNSTLSQKFSLPFKIIAGTYHEPFTLTLPSPLNAFFWKAGSGKVRFVIIPRKAHRPDMYFLPPPLRRAFSPGAIDMAGVLVTPFEEDFKAVTEDEIIEIYRQVGT